MRRRRQLVLLLNLLLVLTASLLGIAADYAANLGTAPLPLRALQRGAVPAIAVLLVVLIIGHVVAYWLESPATPKRRWDPSRTPYPGLEAFTEDEAAVFFGREQQIAELTRRLHLLGADERQRFVTVVGASGSGKSSLVQAGLLPRLRTRRWLILPVTTPGSDPLGALGRAIASAPHRIDTIVRQLRQDPSCLPRYLREARSLAGRSFSRVLLIIDQFEELFTLSGQQERELFIRALAEGVRRDRRLWILVTLRVEFLRDLLLSPHAALFQNPVAIGTLSKADLAMVIERPALLANMRFEPGLVNRVVQDTGTTDALPLLAYLLQELYLAVGPGATATFDDYFALGGVEGALARQLDQVVVEMRGEAGIDEILTVLLKFAASEGSMPTRRRVPLDDLDPRERQVVDAFVNARLLVTDVSNGEPVVQVAHEALFRQWAPLRQKIAARAEQLRQRAELERWAADWEHAGRKDDYLLTGERLALAQQWLENLEAAGQAGRQIREFVETSKRRDLAFLRQVSEGVGKYVLSNVEQYPDLAILLSMAALSECPPTPIARRALMAALAFSHLKLVLKGHSDTVRNLAWSPDGRWIATASRDGTARVWDATDGRVVATLRGHIGMVEMVAWAPDSRRVATASRDRTLRLWHALTGQVVAVLRGAEDVVRGVAWSPDGRWIAGAARDRVVRVWEARTGKLAASLRGHLDNVLGVAWSPDGQRLATASHDRTVIVWEVASEAPAMVLRGHQDLVEGVAWSPDGTRIVTSSGDRTIRIWDAADGRQLLLLRGHHEPVWNVAWSPDGRWIASASGDRTARVWDPDTAEEVAVLRGHQDGVWGVAWSPDGRQVATASEDGTARIWDLYPQGAEQLMLAGHSGGVRAARWSPDGRYIATASDERVIRVWDARSGELVIALTGHHDVIWDVAWSPDASHLLSCSSDRSVRVWRPRERAPSLVLQHDGTIVEGIAWSPDGSLFATGGHDGRICVWQVGTGERLATLAGHQDWVVGLAWSPSGRMLASVSDDRTARIWEVATGSQVATCHGHEGRVRSVAWSPEGARIATASDDRTVRLWNAQEGEEVAVIGVHRDRVMSVSWSRDGQSLLTGSLDRTARVWSASPDLEALQALARRRVFRSLTDEERRAHMLPSPQ